MGCLLLPFKILWALFLLMLALPILLFLGVVGLIMLVIGFSVAPIATAMAVVLGVCLGTR